MFRGKYFVHYDDKQYWMDVDKNEVSRQGLIMWLTHNCEGQWQCGFDDFYLELEEDAVSFKLQFGGIK